MIRAARERLESRQRELDAAKGRSADDNRKPRDKDGKPKSGPRHKREFGVPQDKAQENFTDPDSRIMKRSGAASTNATTAIRRWMRTCRSSSRPN